jgi:hypothetical protein
VVDRTRNLPEVRHRNARRELSKSRLSPRWAGLFERFRSVFEVRTALGPPCSAAPFDFLGVFARSHERFLSLRDKYSALSNICSIRG